ncbi:MAG: AsmA-like C-terminal region-containing protein, partial [Acidobacteriota bacterium]
KGVIKNFPLLATVNRVLKVTGGSGKDTQFDSLTGDFKIAGGKAHSDNINLKAGEMTVHGAGDIGFNLILDIKGRIVFSPEKTQELVHSVGELSSLVNQKGRLVLPLVISGSVDNPSINIDIKDLLKKKLQKDLKDKLLQKLFG